MNDNSHLPSEISTFSKQSWWKTKSGTDNKNLRFAPLNPVQERDFYLDCYADAWLESNGSLEGFNPEHYYIRAVEHGKTSAEALMKAMIGDDTAGVIELNPRRGLEQNYGWITLCYMLPEYRNQGLGVQLIGHAVSFYRRRGRTAIRLTVSQLNTRAISFYRRYGFKDIGLETGIQSMLILMEKKI